MSPHRATPQRHRALTPQLLQGDTGSKVSLAALPSGPGIVAVGSLSGLRGEIAIAHGVTWVSYAEAGGRTRVERSPTAPEGAAFLVLADVPRWQTQTLEASVPFERLPDVIQERAQRAGIDTTRPFPVSIDGTFSAIELNVANGAALGSDKPTEERLHDTAVKVAPSSGKGSIVGFFATSGGERLLHAGKRMHLHIVLPEDQQVGHLDSAVVEAGSKRELPASQ